MILKRFLKALAAFGLIGLVVSSCATIPITRGTHLPEPSNEMTAAFAQAENDFKNGKYSDSLSGYLACIDNFPPNTLTDNALIKAGDIYFARGDLNLAEKAYLTIVRDFVYSDTYDESRYKLGQLYYKQGQYYDAIEILKSLVHESSMGNDANTYLTLAKSSLVLKDFASAIMWFTRADGVSRDVTTKKDIYQNLKAIVDTYLTEDELTQVSNSYIGRAAGGYAAYTLARTYISRGELDNARDELLKIVRTQPDHEYYYEAQGLLKETGERIPISPSGSITIGVILPLSGRASTFGNRVKTGMELASGALGFTEGPKINLIFKDSQGNPAIAKNAVRELAANNDVVAIVGPMTKEVAIAAATEAQTLGIPIITLTKDRTITDIGDFVFRNFLTNPDEIRGLVRYLIQARGFCRFAVLYPEDAYGKEMKELFTKEVGFYGCGVVTEHSYPPETDDFRSIIKELIGKSSGGPKNVPFDALFIPDYYNMIGLIIPYIYFYDVKNLTLVGTDGWNDPGLLELSGDYLIGSYFADAFTPNSNRPEVRRFVEDYKEMFGKEPNTLDAYGYDTIKMIQYLVKTQGIRSRDDMRDGLLSIRDYEGVTGNTTIERNGDSTKEPLILTVTEAEEEPSLSITEEPEEGVAVAEELPATKNKKYIIIEVLDSQRY